MLCMGGFWGVQVTSCWLWEHTLWSAMFHWVSEPWHKLCMGGFRGVQAFHMLLSLNFVSLQLESWIITATPWHTSWHPETCLPCLYKCSMCNFVHIYTFVSCFFYKCLWACEPFILEQLSYLSPHRHTYLALIWSIYIALVKESSCVEQEMVCF